MLHGLAAWTYLILVDEYIVRATSCTIQTTDLASGTFLLASVLIDSFLDCVTLSPPTAELCNPFEAVHKEFLPLVCITALVRSVAGARKQLRP